MRFYKYQATGNDFVIIDNREGKYQLTTAQIKQICDRKFGIGADGLMLIEKHPSSDFNLVYFNSDGSQSLCGNGSRAAVQLASTLGVVNGKATFNAYDGIHEATVFPSGTVRVKLNDVKEVRENGDDYFINTGSPHFIRFVEDVSNFPVVAEGRGIRYSEAFQPGGTNVNFVELQANNSIFVRTYERGVEDETLSCGTGVTAAALASALRGYSSPVQIKTPGGDLSVEFKYDKLSPTSFSQIYLVGPAQLVFEGDIKA